MAFELTAHWHVRGYHACDDCGSLRISNMLHKCPCGSRRVCPQLPKVKCARPSSWAGGPGAVAIKLGVGSNLTSPQSGVPHAGSCILLPFWSDLVYSSCPPRLPAAASTPSHWQARREPRREAPCSTTDEAAAVVTPPPAGASVPPGRLSSHNHDHAPWGFGCQ